MASIKTRVNKDGSASYVVLFRHGTNPKTGKPRQTSETFPSMASAEKFRAAVSLNADVALAMLNQKAPGRTVDALFTEWLALKANDLTDEGHKDYVRQYKKWIKPTFGWRDAELVTEKDVQSWVDKVLRAPGADGKATLGPKSVAKKHALLHGMYAWASSKTVGYIENDPCTETKLPKKAKRPPRGLLVPELHALLEAGERIGEQDAADVVAVMAGTGWRPGEVLGLIGASAEVMPNGHVYLTMLTVYRRGEGIVEGGKTEAAGRRLRVLGPGAAVIRRRVIGRGIEEPLFPHPSPGRGRGHAKGADGRPVTAPWSPQSFVRNYWPKLVKEAGLALRKPTPYSLRHTHVMLCVMAKMELPEIQRRLGHESIQTTIDVYGRMIDGMSDESAEALEELLTPGSRPEVVVGEVVTNAIG